MVEEICTNYKKATLAIIIASFHLTVKVVVMIVIR